MARKTPNLTKGKRRANHVPTRRTHECFVCGFTIPKGVKAKEYYINGLGRVLCHPKHTWEEIQASLDALVGTPAPRSEASAAVYNNAAPADPKPAGSKPEKLSFTCSTLSLLLNIAAGASPDRLDLVIQAG